jgi:hypothetical protein
MAAKEVPNFNVRPKSAEAKSSQLCGLLGNAKSEGKVPDFNVQPQAAFVVVVFGQIHW